MRLGTKGKKALGYAKKGLVVAGAIGSIVGLGVKATHKVEDKVEDTKAKIDAGKIIAGGVFDAGKEAFDDAKANPLKAKAAADKGKLKIKGIAGAAKIDPEGTAEQLQFAKNPTADRTVADKRYGTPDEGGTGRVVDRGGFSATGGGGDIRVCDKKYQGKRNANQRRKCKNRVRAGGMP